MIKIWKNTNKYHNGGTPSVGDKIIYVNDKISLGGAKIGATAVIYEFIPDEDGDSFIKINWDRNELSGCQDDGGYFANRFNLQGPRDWKAIMRGIK